MSLLEDNDEFWAAVFPDASLPKLVESNFRCMDSSPLVKKINPNMLLGMPILNRKISKTGFPKNSGKTRFLKTGL
jgi:hypothetical protein